MNPDVYQLPNTGDDLILATAFGLSAAAARPFYESLRRTGWRGRLVVFTANLGPAARAAHRDAGAEVVQCGTHLHRVLRRPMQVLFWRFVRRWPDAGAFSPPWDRLQQANVLRWSLYRNFLARQSDGIRRVLMTDMRDVIFQADPLAACTDGKLRVVAEEGGLTVEQSGWNQWIMRRAFGPGEFNRFRNLRVFCSGIISGGVPAVRDYCERFHWMLPEVVMPDHGADQPMCIRIVSELDASNVHLPGNREGETCHLHSSIDAAEIPRDTQGRLLNIHGEPFAILHQYDRHPPLAEELIRISCGGQ